MNNLINNILLKNDSDLIIYGKWKINIIIKIMKNKLIRLKNLIFSKQ